MKSVKNSSNCNSHNTDYITNKKKYLIKRVGDEFHIWVKPNQCVVIKQCSFNF